MYDADDDGAVTFDEFMKAIESFAGIESEADKCRCKALFFSLTPAGACVSSCMLLLAASSMHSSLLTARPQRMLSTLRFQHAFLAMSLSLP